MTRRREVRDGLPSELPGAPCRICGAWVREGTGDSLPESQAVVRLGLEGRPLLAQGEQWRRAHAKCRADIGWVISKIVGEREPLPKAIARRVLERADVTLCAFQRDIRGVTPKPFGYVTLDERRLLREAVTEVKRQVSSEPDGSPRHCLDGACGACGVAQSRQWWQSPLVWADGSPAPLCESCGRLWQTAGEPRDREVIRAVAEADMAGVRRQAGEFAVGLRLFVEVAGEEHEGHASPWSYSAALTEVIRRAEDRHPAFVIDDIARGAALKRQSARRARAQAERAEQTRREQPGHDIEWTA